MTPNPLIALVFHWIGGLASARFYIPYRGVRNWAWETYRIVALKEWRGASARATTFLVLSLAVLAGSTIIIGYGNYLGTLNY